MKSHRTVDSYSDDAFMLATKQFYSEQYNCNQHHRQIWCDLSEANQLEYLDAAEWALEHEND